MNATATIRTDHLHKRGLSADDYTGRTFKWGDGCTIGDALIGSGERARFALIDDDGVKYYSGIVCADSPDALDDAIEWLYNWGMVDSGTTVLEQDGEVVYG